MAEGRSRAAWSHTSAVMALLANCNRDARRRPRPYTAEDFFPPALLQKGPPGRKTPTGAGVVVVTRENIGDLKAAFNSLSRRCKR